MRTHRRAERGSENQGPGTERTKQDGGSEREKEIMAAQVGADQLSQQRQKREKKKTGERARFQGHALGWGGR